MYEHAHDDNVEQLHARGSGGTNAGLLRSP